MTYEGGWAVQADFDHYGMLAWNDLRYGSEVTDPEYTKRALRNAFNVWCEYGGYIYAYFYPVTPNIADTTTPLLQEVRESNNRLVVPPTSAGALLPAVLTPETSHSKGGVGGPEFWGSWYSYWLQEKHKTPAFLAEIKPHCWNSWLAHTLETAEYDITLKAEGGPCLLLVDGKKVAEGEAGEGLKAKVEFLYGVHAIRVQSLDQGVTVSNIAVEKVK
jgi:hypothetical protein